MGRVSTWIGLLITDTQTPNQPDYSWKGQSVTGQCDKLVFFNFYIDIINIPNVQSRCPYCSTFKVRNLLRRNYKWVLKECLSTKIIIGSLIATLLHVSIDIYWCQNWRTGQDNLATTAKCPDSDLYPGPLLPTAPSSWNISRAGELWRAIFISAGDQPPANLICTLSICYIDKYQPTAATLRHGLLAGDFIILDCWFAFLSILVEFRFCKLSWVFYTILQICLATK